MLSGGAVLPTTRCNAGESSRTRTRTRTRTQNEAASSATALRLDGAGPDRSQLRACAAAAAPLVQPAQGPECVVAYRAISTAPACSRGRKFPAASHSAAYRGPTAAIGLLLLPRLA